jgi:hypothetical protein
MGPPSYMQSVDRNVGMRRMTMCESSELTLLPVIFFDAFSFEESAIFLEFFLVPDLTILLTLVKSVTFKPCIARFYPLPIKNLFLNSKYFLKPYQSASYFRSLMCRLNISVFCDDFVVRTSRKIRYFHLHGRITD